MAKTSTSNISIRMDSEGNPTRETVSALLEAERIAKDSSVKGYHDVDELFADLDA